MNKNKLKIYTLRVRRGFVAALTQWEHLFGMTAIDIFRIADKAM